MARRRKKKKRVSVKVKRARRKKRSRIDWAGVFKRFGKIAAVVVVVAGIAVGFIYLQKDVDKKIGKKAGPLVFVWEPLWFNDTIKAKVFASAAADGEDFMLDEDAAKSVRENLESDAWLSDVKVQAKSDYFEITAKFHRPLAMVEKRGRKYYIDHEMNVLDYVDVGHLPIVWIKGVSTRRLPNAGQFWSSSEAAAAIEVLASLDGRDARVSPEKPLLFEIDSIDVSNFQGRKNSKNPHIILFARDGTEVTWGAEIGSEVRYFESSAIEKLDKLYNYYKELGTLQGQVSRIELRIPQGEITQPIDVD